jgi:hypothetical protein
MEDSSLKAAAFLVQALELEDEPRAIADEVIEIKRDANAGIYTAQFDSSVGPAAFLIYVYVLDAINDEGRTGRDLFEADRQTLETAAERNAPGPRIMAHALTAADGYILTTTPATWRALTAQPPLAEADRERDDGGLPPSASTADLRRIAAGQLLELLRAADARATTWLAAVSDEGRFSASPAATDALAGELPFNAEETELALFLLDERSIQNLLRSLNVVLTEARRQAIDAFGNPTAG